MKRARGGVKEVVEVFLTRWTARKRAAGENKQIASTYWPNDNS